MEPAGLAIGVLAITGLLNNAVDCLKYIQISRNFGHSYQIGLPKLDSASLHLSRLGQSVGLRGELKNTQSLSQALKSA